MKRLMKAELYKFGHEKSVWIISAVLIACACISIFTQVYASAENAFTNLGKDVRTKLTVFDNFYTSCKRISRNISSNCFTVPSLTTIPSSNAFVLILLHCTLALCFVFPTIL